MKITNTIIIIDKDSEIWLTPEEYSGFTGNTVFPRDMLPDDLVMALDRVMGRSTNTNASGTGLVGGVRLGVRRPEALPAEGDR